MKIGFLLDDTLDSTDGVQQYVLALGKQFGSQGHEVHYLVGETQRVDVSAHSLTKNIKVGFNKNRMSTPLPVSRKRVRKLLDRLKLDVIHVQMPYSPFMAGVVLREAQRRGIATIGTFHILPASHIERWGLRMLGKLQKKTLQRLSSVIAVSQPAKDCADTELGTNALVIPNPVDVSFYRPAKSYQKAKKPLSIVFLGRLVERKGCHELLEAVKWLHNRDFIKPNELTIQICGDGPQRSQLEHFVRFNKLSECVTFLGRVSEQEKKHLLQKAHISVFPSLGGESFGIVLIEAMAAGTDVVLAGDNPGYRFVMDGNEQQLTLPKKTDIFAAQLLHFIQNVDARKMAAKWQSQRLKTFTLPRVASNVLKQYERAVAKSNKH